MATGLVCAECGELLAGNVYQHSYKSGMKELPKIQQGKICKPCFKLHQKCRYKLMKLFPPPPAGSPCSACGRIDKLFCDHDHAITREIDAKGTGDWEKAFRGYICRNCNGSLGLGGDSEEGILKLLEYLRSVPKRQAKVQKTIQENGRGD